MRSIALAVLILALNRYTPKRDHEEVDIMINGMLQLCALVAFLICIVEGL